MSILIESPSVDHVGIPAAVRPTTKAPERPVGPPPPIPERSWTGRHALEFGPKWSNIGPEKVVSLTPAQRAFVCNWSRARELADAPCRDESCDGSCGRKPLGMIPAAELAEIGAVEDAEIEPDWTGWPTGPSPEDVAWLHGYEGGRQGIDAAEPDDCSPDELIAWNAGKFSGETDRWNAARNARVLAEA